MCVCAFFEYYCCLDLIALAFSLVARMVGVYESAVFFFSPFSFFRLLPPKVYTYTHKFFLQGVYQAGG